MTVVAPSLTRTEVFADWVLIGGTAARSRTYDVRPKSGEEFSTVTCMNTVPASVICGVTFIDRPASLKATVTVPFETVWYGIWMPCLMVGRHLVLRSDTRGGDDARAYPKTFRSAQGCVEIEASEDVAHGNADAGVQALRPGG